MFSLIVVSNRVNLTTLQRLYRSVIVAHKIRETTIVRFQLSKLPQLQRHKKDKHKNTGRKQHANKPGTKKNISNLCLTLLIIKYDLFLEKLNNSKTYFTDPVQWVWINVHVIVHLRTTGNRLELVCNGGLKKDVHLKSRPHKP